MNSYFVLLHFAFMIVFDSDGVERVWVGISQLFDWSLQEPRCSHQVINEPIKERTVEAVTEMVTDPQIGCYRDT